MQALGILVAGKVQSSYPGWPEHQPHIPLPDCAGSPLRALRELLSRVPSSFVQRVSHRKLACELHLLADPCNLAGNGNDVRTGPRVPPIATYDIEQQKLVVLAMQPMDLAKWLKVFGYGMLRWLSY